MSPSQGRAAGDRNRESHAGLARRQSPPSTSGRTRAIMAFENRISGRPKAVTPSRQDSMGTRGKQLAEGAAYSHRPSGWLEGRASHRTHRRERGGSPSRQGPMGTRGKQLAEGAAYSHRPSGWLEGRASHRTHRRERGGSTFETGPDGNARGVTRGGSGLQLSSQRVARREGLPSHAPQGARWESFETGPDGNAREIESRGAKPPCQSTQSATVAPYYLQRLFTPPHVSSSVPLGPKRSMQW